MSNAHIVQRYHAQLIDETQNGFEVDVIAQTKNEAISILQADFPQSKCIRLETNRQREKRIDAVFNHFNQGEIPLLDDDFDDDYQMPIYNQ